MTDELLHATVSVRGVIIDPRGRNLVLQRATDGEWELPGGRLAPREPVCRGLRREITEETGISVEIYTPVATNAWVNDNEEGRFAAHYKCYTSQRNVDISDEHVDSAWMLPERACRVLNEPQTAAVRTVSNRLATGQPADQSLSQD
ncbi:NUDIX domain-containing protein [Halorubrum ezzemoulense]|jgi:8-oxo-dGTP pyrophosphatase MutT (NUDIX family)|uniref:NUDIX domain-containing protein n=1 Tax=Halorubrum ezzemoulense TaxID=337243 RepID=UPI002331594A|nr:NUDIX domain-containing protein [Halorubrum ezzemoulense]MDB9249344.1 NUDIX domain-containing protein [Halorubrum ezzemoulense]MDB9257564.1 NUDIX domain-containing protein [Halorubrum ezzemoulense]MDB9262073.1 NUDIX domain-containing protein [Halorubrum ezzemoulense]MDB9265576.1 NUDIX domain-containing protein [Halorubrum ezzemoulense]MDB9267925.1 NUDIX domain-containing protein [Halorubrum ezzemoulense]